MNHICHNRYVKRFGECEGEIIYYTYGVKNLYFCKCYKHFRESVKTDTIRIVSREEIMSIELIEE